MKVKGRQRNLTALCIDMPGTGGNEADYDQRGNSKNRK